MTAFSFTKFIHCSHFLDSSSYIYIKTLVLKYEKNDKGFGSRLIKMTAKRKHCELSDDNSPSQNEVDRAESIEYLKNTFSRIAEPLFQKNILPAFQAAIQAAMEASPEEEDFSNVSEQNVDLQCEETLEFNREYHPDKALKLDPPAEPLIEQREQKAPHTDKALKLAPHASQFVGEKEHIAQDGTVYQVKKFECESSAFNGKGYSKEVFKRK